MHPTRIIPLLLILAAAAGRAQEPSLLWSRGGAAASVVSLAQSYDGGRILSGTNDGLVRMWDAATGNLLRTFYTDITASSSSTPYVRGVAFSHDGRYVAGGGSGLVFTVWESATGKIVGKYRDTSNITNGVVFTPDDAMIVTGHDDGTLRYWTPQAVPVRTVKAHPTWIDQFVVSPDGSLIATGSLTHDSARIWNCVTGEPIATIANRTTTLARIAFATNSRLVLSYKDTVHIWNVGTRSVEAGWHPVGASRLSCSVTGDTLAAQAGDSLMLYETMTGRLLGIAARNFSRKAGVAQHMFLADGKRLLLGTDRFSVLGANGVLQAYDLATARVVLTCISTNAALSSIGFSDDGGVIAFGDDRGNVYACSTATGAPFFSYQTSRSLGKAGVSPDARFAAIDEADSETGTGYVTLFPIGDTLAKRTMRRSTSIVGTIAAMPGGRAALGFMNGHGVYFDTDADSIGWLSSGFQNLYISRDGSRIAGINPDYSAARVWSAPSMAEIRTISKVYGSDFAFSPNGELVGDWQYRDTIHIWSMATGALVARVHVPSEVVAMGFSPDGRSLVTASVDSLVRFVDMATGTTTYTYPEPLSFFARIVVSPDSRFIALERYEKGASTLTLMSAGGRLASAPGDGAVAGTLRCAAVPNPFGDAVTVTFSLPSRMEARLGLYDAMGREIAVLADGVLAAGEHTARRDAADLPAGVYYARLSAGGRVATVGVVRGR